MITSLSNSKVKHVIALQKKAKKRNEEGVFIVEGIKMFLELKKEMIQEVYLSESFSSAKEGNYIVNNYQVEIVKDSIFQEMSDTKTPQGVLAVVKQMSYTLEEIVQKDSNPMLLLLEHIQDPGNLGTMIRAGEGAGVTGIIMSKDTVDIYNQKVIRSTMGSVYRVPFVYVNDLKDIVNKLKTMGITTYAAHLLANESYDKKDYKKGCAFCIGNEANGLSKELSDLSDEYIKIPMLGQVESLNAAMAATILMYEGARQRRD